MRGTVLRLGSKHPLKQKQGGLSTALLLTLYRIPLPDSIPLNRFLNPPAENAIKRVVKTWFYRFQCENLSQHKGHKGHEGKCAKKLTFSLCV